MKLTHIIMSSQAIGDRWDVKPTAKMYLITYCSGVRVVEQVENAVNLLLADLNWTQSSGRGGDLGLIVLESLDLDLLVKLDGAASLRLLAFGLHVRGDKVGRKKTLAAMVRALPPVVIAVVGD
jgi:hypothetical protein